MTAQQLVKAPAQGLRTILENVELMEPEYLSSHVPQYQGVLGKYGDPSILGLEIRFEIENRIDLLRTCRKASCCTKQVERERDDGCL
jgi:hypothetical protein